MSWIDRGDAVWVWTPKRARDQLEYTDGGAVSDLFTSRIERERARGKAVGTGGPAASEQFMSWIDRARGRQEHGGGQGPFGTVLSSVERRIYHDFSVSGLLEVIIERGELVRL